MCVNKNIIIKIIKQNKMCLVKHRVVVIIMSEIVIKMIRMLTPLFIFKTYIITKH